MRNFVLGNDYASALPGQKMIRRAMGYYGPGDYKKFMRNIVPEGTFAYMGRQLGGMTGIPGLNAAGAYAGNKLAKFVGFGDYTSNQIAGGQQSQISVNQHDMSGDIYVTRTEFVQNITVSGAAGQPTLFQVTSYALNPGLQQTFPWLSQVASNFTMYEFNGLMFQYKPLFSEDAGTSANLGKIVMATQYDPNSGPFRTSVEMENYDYANSSKPSMGLVHGVETANHQQALNMQYVRTGSTARDRIFTDIGTFQVGTEGVPLAAAATQAIIGELWVTYSVKLSRAELYNSLLGAGINTDILRGSCSAAQLTTGTTFQKSSNSIGITVFPVSATSFTMFFPLNISLGYYQFVVQFSSGATVFTTQQVLLPSGFVNCQNYIPGSTIPGAPVTAAVAPSTPIGTTSNQALLQVFYVYVNSPGLNQAQFTVNTSAALTATSTWQIFATQANADVAGSVN